MKGRSIISSVSRSIALTISVLLALILPVGYFSLSYNHMKGGIETEVEIIADIVSGEVSKRPDTWQHEQARLEEMLSHFRDPDIPEKIRILDDLESFVAEKTNTKTLAPPHLTRSRALLDSGVAAGKIEVIYSLRPLLVRTAMFAVLGILLGITVFGLLLVLPLRLSQEAEEDLRKARADLESIVERRTAELTIANEQLQKEISEHTRAEEELQTSEDKYRSLVESIEDSIYLVDRDCTYLFLNKKHLTRMGLPGDQLMGHSYADFHSPKETEDFIEQIRRVLETGESLQHEHLSRRDGEYFLRTFSPVRDPEGRILAVTVVSKQITARKRMEEELRAMALTDELTGLYNRRGFFTLAEQQLRIADRVRRGLVLLSADLDNLKEINDTLGHHEGDLALIETARILQESFRGADIIARIGGDEFMVLLIENVDKASLPTLTARLQKKIEESVQRSNGNYRLSMSVGSAYYNPEAPCSLDRLIAQADGLMYEQKRQKQKS